MGKFPTISRTSCTLPRLLGKHSMLSLIGKPCVGHVRENHLIFLIVFPKFRTCDIMCSIQDSSACMDPQPSTPMHPARIPQQESSSSLRSHKFHKSQESAAKSSQPMKSQPAVASQGFQQCWPMQESSCSCAACCLSPKKQYRNSLSPACLHVRNMRNTKCTMVNTK